MRTIIEQDDVMRAIKNGDLGEDDILSFVREYSDHFYDKEHIIDFRNQINKILDEKLQYYRGIDEIEKWGKETRI